MLNELSIKTCLSKTKPRILSSIFENFKGVHSSKEIKSLAKLIFNHENVLSHRNSVKWCPLSHNNWAGISTVLT